LTDSESLSGVAPCCPKQDDASVHVMPDGVKPGVSDVYECCPGPHIECWTPSGAQVVLTALNAAGAELCS